MEYIKFAVIFAAGIYLSERICAGFALIFMLSLILVLTIKAFFKREFNIKILAVSAVFIAGALICRYASRADIRDLSRYEGRYVTLTGRVCEIPEQSEDNVRYTVDVRKVSHAGSEKDVKDRVLLTAAGGYKYGDTVVFSGFIKQIPAKMNENGFDFAQYYKSKKIFFKIYSSDIQVSEDKIRDYSPCALSTGVKNYICGIIDDNYTGDKAAVLKAALAGNKKEFSEEFDEILNRTGAKRFFYPAFLHVMLFMSLITLVLGMFDKKKRDMITVFLLIIYALFNSSGEVFVKLSLTLALFTFLKSRFGHVYYFDVIGLTALIMGVINPLVYFRAGFVMSMLSSILIHYFYDGVYPHTKRLRFKYIRRMCAIGFICTVGLIPISAYFFGCVSLTSISLSVIMLPCVAAILALSPVLLVMLALFHTAPVIGQVVSFMTFVLRAAPYLADKLSLSYTVLPKPSVLFLLIYLFLIIAAVKYVKKKKSHMKLALFVAAALTVSAVSGEILKMGSIEIDFVNVGQGDGAVIRAPHRFNVLIDGGGGNAYSDYDPGEKVYLEYLVTEGITKVDSAFVSHYHQDHVQGIIAALKNIEVRNLFLPDVMEGSEWRAALEEAAAEGETRVHYISEETLLTYNNGMTIRIIPPAEKTFISDEENDTTFLYRMEYGGFSALFTGDMTSFGERNLIEEGNAKEADLLKVAHHGSKTSTSKEWAEAVKPDYSVISVGEDNTFALPDDETLETLGESELFRTDRDGDIRFTVKKNGKCEIETLNGR